METYENRPFCHGSNRTCFNTNCHEFFSQTDMECARTEFGVIDPPIDFQPFDKDCEYRKGIKDTTC